MRTFVSLHLARTAGTSFARFLRDEVAHEVPTLILYGPGHPYHGLHWRGRSSERTRPNDAAPVRELIRTLEPEHERLIVHGHLSVADAERLLGPGELSFGTWLREPIARIVSHYEYWRDDSPEPPRVPALRALHRAVRNGDVSVVEFGSNDLIRNYYRRALAPLDAGDLSFVGRFERRASDLARFAERFGLDLRGPFPHENAASAADRVRLSSADRQALGDANADDLRLYEGSR